MMCSTITQHSINEIVLMRIYESAIVYCKFVSRSKITTDRIELLNFEHSRGCPNHVLFVDRLHMTLNYLLWIACTVLVNRWFDGQLH
jgi:hypothetical protein